MGASGAVRKPGNVADIQKESIGVLSDVPDGGRVGAAGGVEAVARVNGAGDEHVVLG